jgi:alanyl-tRNA synthetase
MAAPGTPRIYFDDPLILSFDARVIAQGDWKGAPSLILDRTAFYPEAGGQMADRGRLAGAAIVDVQEDDAGVVHHVLAPGAALPAIGSEIGGTVDASRRRLHMSLHTGQHMLSRALVDVARGETVSSRLGETVCTIDLDRDKVEERDLARAEELVNSVIEDDVGVRAFFPTESELRSLPLRRAPKVTDNIRVVQIGDFDVSPCGGTHCLRSSQVGFVRITGVERYKGKVRVSFAAGRRARDELYAEAAVLETLGRGFTCGPLEVPAAVEKLKRELASAREALGHARARLAETAAEELLAALPPGAPPRVVAVFDDADAEWLRVVAKKITARPGAVALLAARTPDGVRILAARGEGSSFDCGAFVKKAAAASGGRGGGRPEQAEGNLPAGADWNTIAAMA